MGNARRLTALERQAVARCPRCEALRRMSDEDLERHGQLLQKRIDGEGLTPAEWAEYHRLSALAWGH